MTLLVAADIILKMQKMIPILILLLVILTGGVGIYFLFNQKNPTSNLIQNTQPSPTIFFPQTQANSIQSSPTASPSKTPAIISSQDFPDGLKIEDYKIGTSSAVKSGDTIIINYIGMLDNGQKFDSSYDRGQPFETQIGVGQVIKGWDEGIIGMQVGGQRRLIIPSSLGYGESGVPGQIPANATLIFDVELEAIK